MKKLNILICILPVIFTFTACGNTDNEPENITTATTFVTTVTTSATLYESSLPVIENKVSSAEASTAVTTSIVPTEATTAYTTTKPTTTEVLTTAPTTIKTTTTKPITTKPATTLKQTTTKPTTTKPTTTKAVTTTKTTTTKPTTTTSTTQTTTEAKKYCTVRIECNTIYDNIDKLKSGKQNFLTANGVILDNVQVELNGSESAFNVIKKACEENVCTDNCQYCKASGVQIEYTYTPAFNNYYIEGIHQIYEKDCGNQSGWMYSVNGVFPDVGSSSYTVSPGDIIVFSFTCNMGEDIGNTY